MFPFPVVAVPVPRHGGRYSSSTSWRRIRPLAEAQTHRGGEHSCSTSWRGYDRSRRRKRSVAGPTTPSARARRRRNVFERVAGPPRERVSSRRGCPRSPSWRGIRPLAEAQASPGGSYNSLREGAPSPRRAWASGARRPREQVSPRRGCSRSRSWMFPFPHMAGDTTARGGANASWRELQLPPRGRTPSARTHSLREGAPPPRGPWTHSVGRRLRARSARRPRTQVSPQRGFRCAPRGRTRGWRAPGLPHQQPSAPSRFHPAATTVRSRHEGSRHRGQSR